MTTRANFVDISGQRFGAWLVLHRADSDKDGRACWLCRCDCGTEKIQKSAKLRHGNTTRCRRCSSRDIARTHPMQLARAARLRPKAPQPPSRCVGDTDWESIGDKVLSLAEQGVSRREIALRYGLSKGSVTGWLYRNRDIIGYHGQRQDQLLPLEVPEHLR